MPTETQGVVACGLGAPGRAAVWYDGSCLSPRVNPHSRSSHTQRPLRFPDENWSLQKLTLPFTPLAHTCSFSVPNVSKQGQVAPLSQTPPLVLHLVSSSPSFKLWFKWTGAHVHTTPDLLPLNGSALNFLHCNSNLVSVRGDNYEDLCG